MMQLQHDISTHTHADASVSHFISTIIDYEYLVYTIHCKLQMNEYTMPSSSVTIITQTQIGKGTMAKGNLFGRRRRQGHEKQRQRQRRSNFPFLLSSLGITLTVIVSLLLHSTTAFTFPSSHKSWVSQSRHPRDAEMRVQLLAVAATATTIAGDVAVVVVPPRHQVGVSDSHSHSQQKQQQQQRRRRLVLQQQKQKQQDAAVTAGDKSDDDQIKTRFRGYSTISTPPSSMPQAAATETMSADSATMLTPFKNGMPRLKKQTISRRTTPSSASTISTPRATTTTTTSTSRSSTMPGFMIPTLKQQSHTKLLRQIEDRTGQDFSALETAAVRKRRSQVSGDAMYQSSSSVPDSLMQFAKELHQVSLF